MVRSRADQPGTNDIVDANTALDVAAEADLHRRKGDLRRSLRSALSDLETSCFVDAGADLVAALEASPRWEERLRPGAVVALYASRSQELSTTPLDEMCRSRGCRRLVPAMVDRSRLVFREVPASLPLVMLPQDGLGIGTPQQDWPAIALAVADLVVVPGLGFDVHGGRLGYGRGYYDAALADVDLDRAVGVGVDVQVVSEVPMGGGDRRLRHLFWPGRGLQAALP